MSRETPAAFQKGQAVANYQIVEVLTPTRFGQLYLGRRKDQAGQVLIEGLLPPLLDDLQAEFLKAAQALQQLEHPHILRVREAGVQQGYPFLVTDYFAYRTFSQVYAPPNIPLLLVFLPHLKQIASALHYAHRRSIAHGDIRPENMLLSANNTVLLRGFVLEAIIQNRGRLNYPGAASAEQEAMLYAAPEQIQGNPGFASDQYALGVFIYQLLCGQAPFIGSPVEIAFQKIHAPVPGLRQHMPDSVSPGVEHVVMKALEREPEKRFPDVQAFIDALEQEYQQSLGHLAAVPARPIGRGMPPAASPPGVLGATPPAPLPSPFQDVAPVQMLPTDDLPEEPPEQLPRKARKKTPKPAPPRSKPPARREGGSIRRRAFAVGLVGFAALGGAGGWYLLSQRFAQAAPPTVSANASPPATQTTINHQQGLIFTGHLAGVNALAWSPDGKLIASASDDTFVQVFEVATGTRRLIYRGHTEEVAAVAWSPDGKLIASAGQDQTVQLWNAASGGAPVRTYKGHTDRVNSVAWSRKGQLLTSGSDDKSVQVWQAGNGARIFTFLGHTAGVLCVGWQPNESSVASGSWDGTLRDWATVQHGDHFDAGDQIFDYGGHGTNEVYALAWSPDGKLIASAGADQTVQVSNGVDGTPKLPSFTDHRRQDHINRVFAVAWSPDGTAIASGDQDGNVYVWKAADRKTFFRYTGHQGAVNAVAWSPDGKFIASGSADTTVHIWQPG
ncbi:MAG TPA: protein kinase [Ktedonobacterales bacterium]|nr:protein kinase [Ktedonobacterales bacterium]